MNASRELNEASSGLYMSPRHWFMLGLGLQLLSIGLYGEIPEAVRGSLNGFGLALVVFCNHIANADTETVKS